MLDILEDYLLLRRPELGGYERVDGDVAGAERQAAIIVPFRDRSQTFPRPLCALRAGGYRPVSGGRGLLRLPAHDPRRRTGHQPDRRRHGRHL